MKLKFSWNRRSFLAALGALTGGVFAPRELNAGIFGKKHKPSTPALDVGPIMPITSGLGSTGDIYAELGVTPLININGTLTVIGGTVMRPEVMELIRRGNEHFVLIDELEIAAGKFIAKVCKSPVGYTGLVTAGAAAAMVVGYAGMMTEDLEPRMRDIPDVSNFPRNEVIIQKSHRYPFDPPNPANRREARGSRDARGNDRGDQPENVGDSLHQYSVRQRKGQRRRNGGNRQRAQPLYLQRCSCGRAAERTALGIDARFKEVEETINFQLRFPSGVLANCTSSYGYSGQNHYRLVGTEAWLELEPATSYRGLRMRVHRRNVTEEVELPERDHFALEMDHMSACVMENKEPLTPGEEGLRDLKIMMAIYEAARTEKAVKL